MRPEEFRAAVERTLAVVAADERISALIAAARLRLRFRFTDCDLTLDIAADGPGDRLCWRFGGDPARDPRFELELDTTTANRVLQGRESLAIAIARGRVRARGDSRAALCHLPLTRLVREPYLRVLESEFPDLADQGI